MIADPVAVLAVLLAVLAGLFGIARHPRGSAFFRVVPLLLFVYFVPTALSNTGIIPLQSPTYEWIKTWLLPASLVLLTISIDVPAILKLGKTMLTLFLAGTVSVVIGGPLALLMWGWLLPPASIDQSWKGMAALSGSWIGGGANFVAIGESVGATDATMGMMIVIDVAIANVWMAILLFFATHEMRMDEQLGADRRRLEELKVRLEKFRREVTREATLADLCTLSALSIGGSVIAAQLAGHLPSIGGILNPFAWTVILVTAFGVAASFSPLRRLEGVGASRVGSLFLYLLVASIGAKAEFSRVFEVPVLLLIGCTWMAIHAATLLLLRRWLKAPVFFMAVGSQANIGGAASAPIVAGAFQPELASVGALLGVAGYVLGTYSGLFCAFLLKWISGIVGGI